jgi:hypothetical protein
MSSLERRSASIGSPHDLANCLLLLRPIADRGRE